MSKNKRYQASLSGKRPSKRRLFLFKAIGIILPFLLLFLLEISLRLFHYGYNTDLFIESPSDPDYLVFNSQASKRYFADEAIATTGNRELFKKEKDENTLRIFVLGESTTIGYPYFHNGSFHRWLAYRLRHSFPDRNFEIINCSLTAVNSYTVLGFARQLVKYQPDAVLIYSGHNEYYGALGVGSTDRIGGSPGMVNALIWLRGLKLGQLISRVYEKLTGLFENKKQYSGKTRMELMVADQHIPYGSVLFNRGIAQFRSNMDATLRLFSSHQVPVFISNLVSNEKDMKPFVSIEPDSIQYPAFRQNYALGLKAFEQQDFPAATQYFNRAERIYPDHAACNYYLARLAFLRGAFAEAGAGFSRAVDLDALRFRAPHQMNDIISGLCKKYPSAHLVNTHALFESWSDHGIIGNRLILEHLHPNLLGYALLSDAFYESMKKAGLISITRDKEMPFGQLLRNMPITSMDSLTAAIKIFNLKKSWPFSEVQVTDSAEADPTTGGTEEEKLAYAVASRKMSWFDANKSLYDYYVSHRDMANAKTVIETLVLEYPQEEAYYEKAANICGELGDDENAVFYFRKAFDLAPSFNTAKYLFVLYFRLDEPEEAMPYLDYAIRSGGGAKLLSIKELAEEIIRLRKKDTADVFVLNQIAAKYYRMGNTEAASRYLEKVLQLDGKNKEALTLLVRIKNGKPGAGSH